MNNTKHYTHPTLGINVYKGNVAYFDELEKKAQAQVNKDKIKFALKVAALALTVFNPFFYAVAYQVMLYIVK